MIGAQNFTLPVFFLVGRELTEQARDSLSDIIAGGNSIKALLEDNPMTGTDNFVPGCKVETISVAGIEYLSATFSVEVMTQDVVALKDIMDTLAARLSAASYKNVYAYPTSPVQTPGVVIGYPTDIDLQATFG